MTRCLIAYAVSALALVAIDMLWLGVIARPLYRQGIGHLMGNSPVVLGSVAFYLIFPAGLVLFAIAPALVFDGSTGALAAPWWRAVLSGALFGMFCYATYDLSNLATLRDWPVGLSLLDVAWGTALSAATAGLGHGAAARVG